MENYLEILKESPNFTIAKGAAEEAKLRKEVYKIFEPVSQMLSFDEKFQLYDLIDQLKLHDAENRPTVKQEFLEICLKGSDLQAYHNWHERLEHSKNHRNRWS